MLFLVLLIIIQWCYFFDWFLILFFFVVLCWFYLPIEMVYLNKAFTGLKNDCLDT